MLLEFLFHLSKLNMSKRGLNIKAESLPSNFFGEKKVIGFPHLKVNGVRRASQVFSLLTHKPTGWHSSVFSSSSSPLCQPKPAFGSQARAPLILLPHSTIKNLEGERNENPFESSRT